jgi:hypothetical protein
VSIWHNTAPILTGFDPIEYAWKHLKDIFQKHTLTFAMKLERPISKGKCLENSPASVGEAIYFRIF